MFHRPSESSGNGDSGSGGGGRLPDYRHVAPPSGINKKKGYTLNHPEADLSLTIARQKRVRLDDDYFDDDEEEDVNSSKQDNDDEGGDDPLDAFMAGLEQETAKPDKGKKVTTAVTSTAMPMSSKVKDITVKGVRGDIDEEDVEESYYKYMSENPNAGIGVIPGADGEDDEESGNALEYDKDGNPIYAKVSSTIDPLPAIDHSLIKYEEFRKDFYEQHEEIKSLSKDQVQELRKKLDIRVFGSGQQKISPVCSFAHFNFDHQLIKSIIKHGYTTPTSIQAQGIPIALSGRDMIGIAKTGSGKTAAYLLPLMVHIMDQRDLKADEGPIGLILAPTRELVQQIYSEAKKFAKVYNIAVVCVYGGGNRWEQMNDLQAGCEIVVATPGRMIDMIKSKATNLLRVTCLILDEADRMFDLGFEPQVRSICNHVRPDRQTLLFSATMKKRLEKLALDVLSDPLKIIHGESGEANSDISQIVKVFEEGPAKWDWLTNSIVDFMSQGSVLIFVTKKANADELAANLVIKEFDPLLIHGDMDQNSRNKVIMSFKRKEKPILVATDVAARGLDIPHVKTVVNYDVARDIDTHTHRIGRTGRAGEKGVAYTLVTDKDKEFVGHLVRNLESANQQVDPQLMDLAMKSSWFKNSRYKNSPGGQYKGGSNKRMGGSGLGFKSRPAFNPPSAAGSTGTSAGSRIQTDFLVPPPPPSSSSPSQSVTASSSRISQMRAAYASNYTKNFKAATSGNSSNSNWTSSGSAQSGTGTSESSASVTSSLYSSLPPSSNTIHAQQQQQQKRSRWN